MSGTGFGYNFDYIIVHESAHEWFANSITYKDIADMWVHESFATYAEGLYVEYYINKEAGAKYIIGIRQNIANDKPIIGYYDVNNSGSGDMYPKGANMLHMIRQILNNDSLWRNILLDMNKVFYHKTVDTRQIEDFLIDKTKLNLQPIFDQYLRNTSIPVLEYKSNGTKLEYRWTNCIEPFDMPVKIFINNSPVWLKPAKNWNSLKLDKEKPEIKVDDNFYIFNKNSSVQ
jgi:aminopeptidase N